jgi:hypothetical protein
VRSALVGDNRRVIRLAWLLHLNDGLRGYRRQDSLLRIFRVYLNNLQRGSPWSNGFHNEAEQCSISIHAGSVRLAGSRDDRLSAFLATP